MLPCQVEYGEGIIIPPSGGPSSSLTSLNSNIKKNGARRKITVCAHSILMMIS